MSRKSRLQIAVMAGAVAVAGGLVVAAVASRAEAPGVLRYTADGKMEYPADYRSWIFLSSGVDMSYSEAANGNAGSHSFDSVFVNREAWAAFQKTGTWPDKTVMVLEVRRGQTNGSINKHGQFQTDKLGMEVHVKDVARFKADGGWGFFGFRDETPGRHIPANAGCISCHDAHGAVDSTFVQFYPTLLPIAQAKKTLSAAYLKDEAEHQGK